MTDDDDATYFLIKIDELATALAAAQGEFQPIPKDGTNPHFKSKYSSLDAAVHTNKAILAKHGLAVSQTPGFDGEHDTLTTRLIHKSGQMLTGTMRLHPVKDDPQGLASSITYARRQAFLAITGMTPGDDDDAERAQQRTKPPQRVDVETGEIGPPPATPTRRREPPHQPVPDGHIGALTAMKRVIEELNARGIDGEAAKNTASLVWGERSRKDPIPNAEFDSIIEQLGPLELPVGVDSESV